jgi:hypothetical protein
MADLSDFGVETDEPTPEDQVKINLSQWFENHGATVFWEKRPSYGYRLFHTSGADCPDLLVSSAYGTFAIEVKTGEDSASVHDGLLQTHRYWKDYVFDGEPYRADGDSVSVNAFLLASAYSPDGALFYRHGTRDTVRERSILERLDDYWEPPIHFLPDWEFSTTESMIRILWRLSKRSVAESDLENVACAVGAVLSERLDGCRPTRDKPSDPGPFEREPMPAPRALYKTHDDVSGGVNCQHWGWLDD